MKQTMKVNSVNQDANGERVQLIDAEDAKNRDMVTLSIRDTTKYGQFKFGQIVTVTIE